MFLLLFGLILLITLIIIIFATDSSLTARKTTIGIVQYGTFHSEIIAGTAVIFEKLGYQVRIFMPTFKDSLLPAYWAAKQEPLSNLNGADLNHLYVNTSMDFVPHRDLLRKITRGHIFTLSHLPTQLSEVENQPDTLLNLTLSPKLKIKDQDPTPLWFNPVYWDHPYPERSGSVQIAVLGSNKDLPFLRQLLQRGVRICWATKCEVEKGRAMEAEFPGQLTVAINCTRPRMERLFRNCRFGLTAFRPHSYHERHYSGCFATFIEFGFPLLLQPEHQQRYQFPSLLTYETADDVISLLRQYQTSRQPEKVWSRWRQQQLYRNLQFFQRWL